MNTILENASATDRAIMRHLNLKDHALRLEEEAPEAPDETTAGRNNARFASEGVTQSADASGAATGAALYNVLMQYVNLLESPDHGGWTLDEDNTVREAVRALTGAGWKLRSPRLRA